MSEIDPHNPIDKTAAFVVSRSTEKGVSVNFGCVITSLTPLPTRLWHGRKIDDLTGKKWGRFEVIGCALFMPKNYKTSTNNTRWVVRCKCGRYQIFTTKSVKRGIVEMCKSCEVTNGMKRRSITKPLSPDWPIIDGKKVAP